MKKRLLFLLFIYGLFGCKKNQTTQNIITNSDYDKAESFFVAKNNDSSFYYFNKVATNPKDSLQVAMAYNYMAVIQADAGDYFGAQESLLASLNFLDENKQKDFACLASDFNELGVNSLNLKNYDSAISYFNRALKFSKNDNFRLIISNNIALAHRDKKNYREAIKIYNIIISSSREKNTKDYARALTNISFTKWLQNPGYKAETELLTALSIREKENDDWGKNSSYGHLADYYNLKQPKLAIGFALKMLNIANKLKSPDDRLEAFQKLIKLSPLTETKRYFNAYQNLSDSIISSRNAAKNQFALIRYETEKHKSDFLKARAENIEKQKDILVRNIGLGILGIVLISAYFWYRKRKQILRKEKELEVKNTELKYVKKVHDRVANKVYHVMSEVENTVHLDKENLLDKLEILYNISRNISYENKDVNEDDFAQQLNQMLTSYSSENLSINIEGNNEVIWKDIPSATKSEVSYILQELMTNMKKHSKAKHVSLYFEQNNNNINISYTDNGIGIPDQLQYKNGLTNTGNRIDHIQGTITFDTKVEKGLKILISFPIS